MKKCKTCGKDFETIKNRKYCNDCLPHHTKLCYVSQEKRPCSCCGKEVNGHDHLCKECRRIYQKLYVRNLLKWVIDKLGKKCNKCGLTFDYCCFDFHHLDNGKSWSKFQNKENQSNQNVNVSSLKIKELGKWRRENKIPDDVILLCSNCHRIIHNELLEGYNTEIIAKIIERADFAMTTNIK